MQQLLDERNLVKSDFAEVKRTEFMVALEQHQEIAQSAQINGVLGETAAAMNPHGCDECRAGGDPMLPSEEVKRFHKRRSVKHGIDRNDPERQQSQTRIIEFAHEVFCEGRQPLLQFLVSGETGVQLLERLRPPVKIS